MVDEEFQEEGALEQGLSWEDYAAEKSAEKERTGRRWWNNAKHFGRIAHISPKSFRGQEDAPRKANLKLYRGKGKQPRLIGNFVMNAKPNAHRANIGRDLLFFDTHFPSAIPERLKAEFKISEFRSRVRDDFQEEIFLFLLEAFPESALDFLAGQGYLTKNVGKDWQFKEARDRGSFVGFDKYSNAGGYFLWGYEVSRNFWNLLTFNENEAVIPRQIAEQLYELTSGIPEARRRMHLLGMVQPMSIDSLMEVEEPLDSIFGIEEYGNGQGAAGLQLYGKQGSRVISHKTMLRKSDLNGNLRRGPTKKTKKPYSLGRRAFITSILSSSKEPSDANGRASAQRRRERKVRQSLNLQADGHRGDYDCVVDNPRKLYRASVLVYNRLAKADHFRNFSPRIEGAIKIILSYIQSRADRSLPIDIEEVLRLENPVVDYRLRVRWEKRHNIGIITLPHLLGGRYHNRPRGEMAQAEGGEKNEVAPPSLGVIPVSKGYFRNPQAYVISQMDLLRETRNILKGVRVVGDYPILDHRARTILQFAQDIRGMANGEYPFKPEDIAYARVPELRHILEQKQLLGARFDFVCR
ncbi:hypothetical protein HYU14_02230 [Candidatus Woesearchaeota archaeon]|nr:hypothetical protein [Candidatus Woesearchaeota archaeon]